MDLNLLLMVCVLPFQQVVNSSLFVTNIDPLQILNMRFIPLKTARDLI